MVQCRVFVARMLLFLSYFLPDFPCRILYFSINALLHRLASPYPLTIRDFWTNSAYAKTARCYTSTLILSSFVIAFQQHNRPQRYYTVITNDTQIFSIKFIIFSKNDFCIRLILNARSVILLCMNKPTGGE